MADSDFTPDLPPHLLAKRKRQQEEEANNATATASGAKRAASPDEPDKRRKIGPALPAPRDSSPAQETKPRKVVGPAPPPAPLDERPTEPLPAEVPDSEDSSDDDDFGPALPSAAGDVTSAHIDDEEDTEQQPEVKVKRDDWMMMPPKQDDLAARLDPLKARPTKFAGKGASKGDTDSSAWHETPEQKQKRLRDEMMGISSTSSKPAAKLEVGKQAKLKKDEEARRMVNAKTGPSLMEQHEKTKGPEAVDDDPSKRAFDREKDMGTGGRISNSQKKEMLNKAAGFAGKFAGGSYL